MEGRKKQGKMERRGDKKPQPSVTKVPSPALFLVLLNSTPIFSVTTLKCAFCAVHELSANFMLD